MRFFFYCLVFQCALFATVNEPLRWEIFSGYRNDRIHWHIQDPGTPPTLNFSELFRDVEYWINGLTLKVIHRDLSFFLRGAYGTFGTSAITSSGWTADASGYFGYAVNLTAGRLYKVILTPLIGYSGYFEELRRSGGAGTFRQVWNGFFFGGQFSFETMGPVILTAGYAYNLMHNRVHTVFFNPNRQSLKTSSGGNGGQTGWASIEWKLKSLWCLGLGAEIQYFSTRVVDASISSAGRGDFSQKFKLRWTPVSGWGQISRQF